MKEWIFFKKHLIIFLFFFQFLIDISSNVLKIIIFCPVLVDDNYWIWQLNKTSYALQSNATDNLRWKVRKFIGPSLLYSETSSRAILKFFKTSYQKTYIWTCGIIHTKIICREMNKSKPNGPKFYIIKYSKNMFAYIKQLNVFNCNHN